MQFQQKYQPIQMNGIKDESVFGQVTSIIHDDITSDFKIFSVLNDRGEIIKCKGEAPAVRTGLDIRCTGNYTTHPRHGKQFNIDRFQIILPTKTVSGLVQFLGGGLIDGIGVMLAYSICSKFGTVEQIKHALENPALLQEVSGIGPTTALIISNSYKSIEHMEAFLVQCYDYKLNIRVAMKIYEEWGSEALTMLQAKPYKLLEISGVSWEVIDKLAQTELGISSTDPNRIAAAVGYGLKKGTFDSGHVFLYEEQLQNYIYPLLQRYPTTDDIEDAAVNGIIRSEPRVDNFGNPMPIFYPTSLYHAEKEVARTLVRMVQTSQSLSESDTLLSEEANSLLDDIQRGAVLNALKSQVSYITGFPGTGKTLLQRYILEEMRKRGIHNPLLCAPTGRAAKQMERSTHLKAFTIHRALGYNGETFEFNHSNPIPYHTVVVDEASMADIGLFHHLVDALPNDTRLLIIGDVDQLPSVGPGNVLSDIIDSGIVPGVKLTTIYRQGKGSSIPILSRDVNLFQIGDKLPDLSLLEDGSDVGFITSTPKDVEATVRTLVKYTLPQIGFSPDDIQVLSPRREGPGSVYTLNKELREALNPGNTHNDFGRFRIGDKVMQIKNVYNIKIGVDVMNGDQGKVIRIGDDLKSLVIDIEGLGEIPYTIADLKNVVHSYCITVHKSQGGQYPAVILSLLQEHGQLLYKSLLYTAITRAEQKLIIVGDKAAFARALRNEVANKRQTLLMERLQDMRQQIE